MSKPNLIVGVPEAGLVGTIATSYLTQQLKLPEVGYIDSDLIPQVVVVHDSEPRHPIRVFARDNLAVIMSEVPLHPRLSLELAGEVARWAKTKGTRIIVGITSVPFEGGIEREEKGRKVLAIASENRMAETFKEIGAEPFEEGVLAGTYATLLKECMVLGQPNLTLLAESFVQFPDPRAAAAVIGVANRLLSINIDVGNLMKESEEIRLRLRQLIAKTQENMRKMAETPSLYG